MFCFKDLRDGPCSLFYHICITKMKILFCFQCKIVPVTLQYDKISWLVYLNAQVGQVSGEWENVNFMRVGILYGGLLFLQCISPSCLCLLHNRWGMECILERPSKYSFTFLLRLFWDLKEIMHVECLVKNLLDNEHCINVNDCYCYYHH